MPDGSASAEILQPHMSGAELALFRAALAGKRRAVEYGAGGSTVDIVAAGIELDSVESDPAWIERLRAVPALAAAAAAGRWRARHADIGPVGRWGMPVDRSAAAAWPDYSRAVWSAPPAGPVDVVLVDGRFRVACILAALLHAGPDAVICVHDFWNRPCYHVVLEHLVTVASVDTLGLFVPRRPVPTDAVAALWERYATRPD